jgi:molecular chaperone DnaK (HSP70)
MSNNRSVGVDFGTSTSLVAEGVSGRQPIVFPIGRSTAYLPSLVGLDNADQLVVGDDAADLVLSRVKRSVKRCITRYEQEITLGNRKSLSADDAITALLAQVAMNARRGGIELTPDTTRLGCPAMWTGEQRGRLLRLAEGANLPVSDHTLIDEPVAAGVAWVTHQMANRPRTIDGNLLVFDMGGGTLDVALLDVHAEPGQVPEISVLSSWGIDEAGDALDQRIAQELTAQLRNLGVDVENDSAHELLVTEAARQAKLQLSAARDAVVAVRRPGVASHGLTYTREQLEVAFDPQLRRAEELVWAVIRGARVTHEVPQTPSQIRRLQQQDLAMDVDFVLLAGGMSRVPAVASLVERILPGVELHLDAGIAADEAIVAGLAETAAYERINLHRPPFDFVLEYVKAGELISLPVYDAYSPFYPPFFAMQRDILYHEWRLRNGELPSTGYGFLRVYTPGGEPVHLQIDDSNGAVKVPFGHISPAVMIHPNGLVAIVDGRRSTTSFMVPRWPVIRGKDHAILYARKSQHERQPVLDRPWMNDPLFLH